MTYNNSLKRILTLILSNNIFFVNLLGLYKFKKVRRLIEIPKIFKVKNSNIILKTTDNAYNKDIFWLGLESKKDYFTIHLISMLLKNSKNYWDIGADTGIDSIFPALENKDCKIYAFEPIPDSFSTLIENINLNNIKNIFPYNIALSNSTGTTTFYLDYNSKVSSGLTPNKNAVEILVNTFEGDDFIENEKIENPDLIKIDVEGFESQILSSMQNILSYNPIIIVEVLSDSLGKKIEDQLPKNYLFFQINDELKKLEKVNDLKRRDRNNINFLLVPTNELHRISNIEK